MEDVMSAIQGVSTTPVPQAPRLTGPSAAKAPAARTETATQEASESLAVTRAEAEKGDRQAVRKLQAAQPPVAAEQTETPTIAAGRVDLLA
jgi:hypothetical protein